MVSGIEEAWNTAKLVLYIIELFLLELYFILLSSLFFLNLLDDLQSNI